MCLFNEYYAKDVRKSLSDEWPLKEDSIEALLYVRKETVYTCRFPENVTRAALLPIKSCCNNF